jgi:hypothetical protein
MLVSELIDLLSDLSFGRNNPTARERELYLRFLNLANLEMWQIAVNANQYLKTVDIFFNNNEYVANVPEGYYLKKIFAEKTVMKLCKLENVFNIPQLEYIIIDNKIHVSSVNTTQSMKVDPSDGQSKRYVTALILDNPKTLVENVEDIENEVNEPVYPLPYHIGLVHGALFYLYTSNKGFVEKIKYQMIAWGEAKKNLASYYN